MKCVSVTMIITGETHINYDALLKQQDNFELVLKQTYWNRSVAVVVLTTIGLQKPQCINKSAQWNFTFWRSSAWKPTERPEGTIKSFKENVRVFFEKQSCSHQIGII